MKDGDKARGIILQARDRHLLLALETLRVIDREQASRIAPFNSVSRANARLSALTRAQLVKRSFIGTLRGGRKAVYASARSRGFVRRMPPPATLPPTASLHHQLLISELYVATHHPLRATGAGSATLWRRFDRPLGTGTPLIPDALVRLQQHDTGYYFFVEVDRGTESRSIWQRKIELYLQCARSRSVEILLGITRFGVLVVTESERRLHHLRADTAARTDRLFWFATISTIKRDGFWSPIWLRPVGEQVQSLI